jgi:serine/threonine-protein kinase
VITGVAGYTVIERLGRGGMGVVYRAEQLALGREVALKVIAPELAEDPGFRARFERESRMAASIDHPNVVTVYEAGESEGVLFIAMQMVRGEDLRTLIRRGSGLPSARAVSLVAQVAGGLDAAHRVGLVHRDVKPANVLVSAEGSSERAYLSDFGLTKHVTSHGGLTRTGQWVGTVDYVAPELVEGRPADARSDVYSLGCVLYEALTGQVPFPRDSDMAKLYAHVQADPPSLSQSGAGMSRALDYVVRRALSKDPALRPQSAGDLAREAQAAAEGVAGPRPQGSVAAGAAAPTNPRPPPAPRAGSPGPPPRGATPAPRRTSIATPVAIMLAATIVTLGGVAAALIASGTLGGQSKARVSAAPPARTSAGTSKPAPASSVSAPASANAPPVALEPYASASYSAQLPVGWTANKDYADMGAFFETRRSKGPMTILIDVSPGTSGDPRDTASAQEPTGDPSYRRIRWRYTGLNGARAFDWIFNLNGERREDILFYSGGNGYGVLGTGPPSRSREILAITRSVAESIRSR